MKEGAYDFLTKPLRPGIWRRCVQKAVEREALLARHRLLRRRSFDCEAQPSSARARPCARPSSAARRAAPTHATVLLLGESGTGKEVFARAIHRVEPAARAPVRRRQLRGAVRGADRRASCSATRRAPSRGRTSASRASWSWPTAARCSWTRSARCAGSRRSCCACCRTTPSSASGGTHDPGRHPGDRGDQPGSDAGGEAGRFREDLFFRLNVIPITLPAAARAPGGHPAAGRVLPARSSARDQAAGLRLAPEALEALDQYDWPGNVRELENLLERAVVLERGRDPGRGARPCPSPRPLPGPAPLPGALDAAEKAMLVQALRDHAGDKRATARALASRCPRCTRSSRSTTSPKFCLHRAPGPASDGRRPPCGHGRGATPDAGEDPRISVRASRCTQWDISAPQGPASSCVHS